MKHYLMFFIFIVFLSGCQNLIKDTSFDANGPTVRDEKLKISDKDLDLILTGEEKETTTSIKNLIFLAANKKLDNSSKKLELFIAELDGKINIYCDINCEIKLK